MDNQCSTGTFAPPWTDVVTYCEREDGHMGKHQNIERTNGGPFSYRDVTWDDSGSATTNPCLHEKFWNECDYCEILIPDDKTHCKICSQWVPVFELDDSAYIVVDGYLYLENKEEEQIVRDELTVLWFDESRPALKSRIVYRFAEVPEEYRNFFPENAKFKPKESSTGGLVVPYGEVVPKERIEEFLKSYERLE